jgi:hypothetical protein
MMESLLERPDVAKNGIVCLLGLGPSTKAQWNVDRNYINFIKQMNGTMPFRIAAIHHVVLWRMTELVVPFLLFLLNPETRYRYKCYKYSVDLFNELAKCGISKEILPIENGGTDNEFNLADWLEQRKMNNL